jgi:hypothetical protein
MENLFFYAAKESEGSRRVIASLLGLNCPGRVVLLPAGSEFTSVDCLKMRSKDPFVLYAGDAGELAELEVLRDEFILFQVLLVLGGDQQKCNQDLLTFMPRMVFSLDRDLEALGNAIRTLFIRDLKFPGHAHAALCSRAAAEESAAALLYGGKSPAQLSLDAVFTTSPRTAEKAK